MEEYKTIKITINPYLLEIGGKKYELYRNEK